MRDSLAPRMILTITPNPTLDRVIFLRGFRWGEALRGDRQVLTPSGKGVDASLVIHELGGATVASGLSAGFAGEHLVSLLDDRGIQTHFVPAHGETRTAIVVVDESEGRQSTISVPTLSATGKHLAALETILESYADQAWGLICAGSLPPGLPVDSYAYLLRRARRHGLTTLLDSSGPALQHGLAGMPNLLKINRDELRQLDGSMEAAGDAGGMGLLADKLRSRLGSWASDALIITLGDKGTLTVCHDGAYYASALDVPIANRAGAGDALGAGVMLARSRGSDWASALALGTAAAGSVLMNEGTAICQRGQVEQLLPQVDVARFSIGDSLQSASRV